MRLFTTGPPSTAWGMWNRAQLFGKERYKELSRDLRLHLNRMELREGYSLHEILGCYMGELRREAQPHTLEEHKKVMTQWAHCVCSHQTRQSQALREQDGCHLTIEAAALASRSLGRETK